MLTGPPIVPNAADTLLIDQIGDCKAGKKAAHMKHRCLAGIGKVDNWGVSVGSCGPTRERIISSSPSSVLRPTFEGGKAGPAKALTKIGSRCYIADPITSSLRGLPIGYGRVSCANSLVLSNVPAGSKAFGTPCRVLGEVTLDVLREGGLPYGLRGTEDHECLS